MSPLLNLGSSRDFNRSELAPYHDSNLTPSDGSHHTYDTDYDGSHHTYETHYDGSHHTYETHYDESHHTYESDDDKSHHTYDTDYDGSHTYDDSNLTHSDEPPLEIPLEHCEIEAPTTPKLSAAPVNSDSPLSLRIKEIFKGASLQSPKAIEKARDARKFQRSCEEKRLGDRAAQLTLASKTRCYITQDKLFLMGKKAGRGGFSEAWFADEINLSSAAEPKIVVIKRSKFKNFKREKRVTDGISLPPNKWRKLNCVGNVFQLSNKRNMGLGIFEACESDLNHYRYSPHTPVSQLLPILCDFAEALCDINHQGIAHRDIKGANLLVTRAGGGSIGDFGLARRISGRRHNTAMTPQYTAPFIWKNIVDQKNKVNGYQDQAADVFALGVTLQLNVFPKMLKQLAASYQIDIKEKMDAIKSDDLNIDPSWDDQALLEIEKKYMHTYQRIAVRHNVLSLFKPREFVLEKILEVIGLFQEHICSEELSKMKDLAQIMHDLQDSDPRNLTAAMALERFRALSHPQKKAEQEEKTTLSEKSEREEILTTIQSVCD